VLTVCLVNELDWDPIRTAHGEHYKKPRRDHPWCNSVLERLFGHTSFSALQLQLARALEDEPPTSLGKLRFSR
jgi:hypothetical protein